jgi:ABC-type nitrate/sulfonate/bicarbonate transport system permease component
MTTERTSASGLRPAALGVLGMVIVVVMWQIVAAAKLLGTSVASPAAVVGVFGNPAQRSLLLTATVQTGSEAVAGFAAACVAAALAGLLVTAIRPLRRGVDQLATVESAIPFVALAPILLALFSRDHLPAAMAAATAFFPLYIAIVSGLAAAPQAIVDVHTVLGASQLTTLLRARIPAGLPIVATGAKVGVPLAIVGAVIGEWFGASAGVGPVMLVAMRNYQMPMMWATMTATVALALALYGIAAACEWAAIRRFGL